MSACCSHTVTACSVFWSMDTKPSCGRPGTTSARSFAETMAPPSRPQGWSTAALTELRRVLASRPERFTEENLRKAYHAELADIISMVKDAGRREPLMTAQERVTRAIARVTAGKALTKEQQDWLDLIARHLVVNLAIEREDFDELPIFTRVGAWSRANKVFEGQLEALLSKINEAIAA